MKSLSIRFAVILIFIWFFVYAYTTLKKELRMTGEGSIHQAVEIGDIQMVRKLLEQDPSRIKTKDSNGFLPLHLAPDKDTAQILLAHGAEIESRGYEKRTPLHQAAMRGRKDVVDVLLDRGSEVKAVDSNGETPLLIAIGPQNMKNSKDIMELLLAHGADVNFGDGKMMTALHKAVSRNREVNNTPKHTNGGSLEAKRGILNLGVFFFWPRKEKSSKKRKRTEMRGMAPIRHMKRPTLDIRKWY